MSYTVSNLPEELGGIVFKPSKSTAEELLTLYPNITLDELKAARTNKNNLYAIAVIVDGERKIVYFHFGEEGNEPYRKAQGFLIRKTKEGNERVNLSCLVFEDENSRKTKYVQYSVTLNSIQRNDHVLSYEKVSTPDIMRYYFNGIYVSENELNQMISLKQASLVFDPSAFEKVADNDQKVAANDQKVAANDQKVAANDQKVAAKTSEKPSANVIKKVAASANQQHPVFQDFKNFSQEELEYYMLELKDSIRKLQSHYAAAQRFFEQKKKEQATSEAFIKQMECLTPDQMIKMMKLMKNL